MTGSTYKSNQTRFYWDWMEWKMSSDVLTLQCSSDRGRHPSWPRGLWKACRLENASKHSDYPAFSWNENKLNRYIDTCVCFFFHISTGGYNVGPHSDVPFYALHCGRRSPPPPQTSCSPSFSEVRYCISAQLFLTVSNAHQIPQVGGLIGLISTKTSTFTKGLRDEITSKVTTVLHLTCRSPPAGNGAVDKASNMLRINHHLISFTNVASFD